MNDLSFKEILLGITDPEPINELLPILHLPLIITPVEIWVLLPIVTLCSIIEPVFIIELKPIFDPELINTLLWIIVLSFILVFFDMYDVFAFNTWNLNPICLDYRSNFPVFWCHFF